jgi:hypothetical protein
MNVPETVILPDPPNILPHIHALALTRTRSSRNWMFLLTFLNLRIMGMDFNRTAPGGGTAIPLPKPQRLQTGAFQPDATRFQTGRTTNHNVSHPMIF